MTELKLLSPAEVSKILGVATSTLCRMRQTGTGPRFKNATHWAQTGRGRRLHDLRHTAACLWLEAGVSPTTVQAWLGHADLTTTQRYLHYLGTSADETALHRLNQWGDAGGTGPQS